jgi:hypothetical protein
MAGNTLSAPAIVFGVEVTVDFGASSNETFNAVTTVTGQSWVSVTSIIVAQIFGVTADHDEEDGLIEDIAVTIQNRSLGVGFDVYAHAPNGTFGTYKVHCIGM